jgi:hypothetical protein
MAEEKHERQQLREAVVAALLEKTAAGVRVYASRQAPWKPVELPGINVRTPRQDGEREIRGGDMKETITLSVLAIVSLGSRSDDAADALALEVDKAIDADTTFGGLFADAVRTGTETDLVDEQERPIGGALLTYEVEVHTAPRT